MMKLEPTSEETKAMSANDIFLSRLKLLIIMAKAYLKNYPIGRYRKSAIIDTLQLIQLFNIDILILQPVEFA